MAPYNKVCIVSAMFGVLVCYLWSSQQSAEQPHESRDYLRENSPRTTQKLEGRFDEVITRGVAISCSNDMQQRTSTNAILAVE